MNFGISDTIGAFNEKSIGTKVTNREAFMNALADATKKHEAAQAAMAKDDPKRDKEPGQMFVMLPADVLQYVISGVGRRTLNSDDFCSREYRGVVEQFLKREKAEPATGCAVVVYTRAAYESDPEVDKKRFLLACADETITHVVVAVLAFAGPKPPVGLVRFVSNFAGANNEYDMLHRAAEMTDKDISSGARNVMDRAALYGIYLEAEALRLKKLAADVLEHAHNWSVVAD